MSADDLVIRDLVCHFPVKSGVVRAVDHVSVTLPAGEITGLVGESGCGKSVLGMAVLGLNPPYVVKEGSILYQEEDLMRLSPAQMRRRRGRKIGLIPQNPADSLNPVRRIAPQIAECVRVGNEAHPDDPRDPKTEAPALLLRFGFRKEEVPRVLRSYPFELSGGMQQRVAAAMGIASRPDWIIADEPSKGLDMELREEMYEILRIVSKQNLRGMLIITHDVTLAKTLCTRLMVMYAGEILETGKGLLEEPYHPYTSRLIAALPENGMRVTPGMPPSPDAYPEGCRFAPRCPYADERCKKEKPPLATEGNREIRCFHHAGMQGHL